MSAQQIALRAQTIAAGMRLVIGRNSVAVDSLADASAKFELVRNASGRGSRRMPEGMIYDGDALIARVSYNGRVWPIEEWTPGMRPLYDAGGFYGDPQDLPRDAQGRCILPTREG